MNTKFVICVVSIGACLALAGCGGSSGGGGGGVNQQPPPGGGPAAPEAVTVDLGDAVKNVLIQPNTATQFTVTYTMPADLFNEPYTSYGGFRMKRPHKPIIVSLGMPFDFFVTKSIDILG